MAEIPLGPFVLRGRLASGGMADVWRGAHAAQGVPVAVKVITAQAATDRRYRAMFHNEVGAVARLSHPGIVMIFYYGTVSEPAAKASAGALVAEII